MVSNFTDKKKIWVFRPRDCFCNLSLSCSKIEYVDREIAFAIPHCLLLNFLAYPVETSSTGTPTPTKIILWGKAPAKEAFAGGKAALLVRKQVPPFLTRRAPEQKRYRIFYLRGPPYEKNLSFGHCVRYCSRIRSPSLKFFSFPTKASFCGSPVLCLG